MRALTALLFFLIAATGASAQQQQQQPQQAAAAAAAPANRKGAHGGGGGGQGSKHVSCQGSALLINYYVGATWALRKGGVLVPGKTPMSGLSGGAYTSVFNSVGLTAAQQKDFYTSILFESATRFRGAPGYFNTAVRSRVRDLLPDGVASRLSGLVRIAFSQLDGSRTTFNESASWVVDSYVDKNDVIAALTGTDMIPCWTGLTSYVTFRNQPVIDGGYANGFKQLCPGGKTDDCLKLASWYVGPLADQTCDPTLCATLFAQSPDCKSEARTRIRTQRYRNGPIVDRWTITDVQGRCPEKPAYEKPRQDDPYPLPPFVPHEQVTPDIYPGKYNPLPDWDGKPILACQWKTWATEPPVDKADPVGSLTRFIDLTYELGYADARSYLDQELGIEISADSG